MAKLIKFATSSSGELVYRSTGRAAPDSYTIRGGTVYGADGRRVGTIGKGTKAEQTKIAKAERSRRRAGRTRAPPVVRPPRTRVKRKYEKKDLKWDTIGRITQRQQLKRGLKTLAKELGVSEDVIARVDDLGMDELDRLLDDPARLEEAFSYETYGIHQGKGYIDATQANKDEFTKLLDWMEGKTL